MDFPCGARLMAASIGTILAWEGYPFIPNSYGSQGLTVSLNGYELAKKMLSVDGYTVLDFEVTEAALLPSENTLTLIVEHPAAPSNFGPSRILVPIGFHLTRLSVFTAALG